MVRNDKSIFLLYMEPQKEEKHEAINDALTKLVEMALADSVSGVDNYSDLYDKPKFWNGNRWRGSHTTDCGMQSDNMDYKLKNDMITNSLAAFYVRHYRNSIHKSNWAKLYVLAEFYGVNIDNVELVS